MPPTSPPCWLAESTALAEGLERFGLEVPTVNETAVSYLLSRNFKLDVFFALANMSYMTYYFNMAPDDKPLVWLKEPGA